MCTETVLKMPCLQLLVMHEVPISTAEDLCISVLKDQSKQDMLLNNDVMLFGFDSVSSESYAQARSLLVSLSDASNNLVPVALVGLKADLGVSSDITSMVCFTYIHVLPLVFEEF